MKRKRRKADSAISVSFYDLKFQKRIPSYESIIDLWHQFISITLFRSLRIFVDLLEISYFHKCSQQSENDERKELMLSNGDFMPHMMVYVLNSKVVSCVFQILMQSERLNIRVAFTQRDTTELIS